MPKIITTAMRTHLDEETTRLAAIWRITRKDGAQFFFTDHDRDLVFGGDTYRADAGFERTAIRSDAGFAVDNLDLVGVFAEGGIVEDEVRSGLFDGAEIAISFVSWQDPDGHGEVRLRRGTLGETRLTPQGYFHAELRGLSQPLAQSTLEVFSPNCRADFGDQRCKFPIQPPELGRDQTVSEGAFYRVPTAAGTGSARYEDRIYEVIEAGTTAASQPAYDTTIGATTIDGTAALKAYDSFTRVASVEAVTDHRIFTLSEDLSGFADGWFDEGAITFETGANTGRTVEVKSWTEAIRRLELWAPTGLPVEVGDQLRVYPGCHKRVLEDCRDRFRIAETATDTDQARIRLQFLDGSNALLGVVDPAYTNPTGTTFVQIEALGAIPVGSRKIKVRLDIDQVSGATPNLAIDDVTLEIDQGDLRYLTFAVWQVSAQVGRGFPGERTVEITP